jgi:DNA-binding response OmpR family regulator
MILSYLTLTLPDGNGIDLLKCIKKKNLKAGIIILSAKSSLDDKITGLDLGADDYITKPFQLSELNSRIKAVLRRHHFDGSNVLQFNEIKVDTASKTIRVNDEEIIITKKEYDMLLYFIIK